jgi:hypothetical protein
MFGCSEECKDVYLLSVIFLRVPDDYLFRELLELVDLDFKAHDDTNGCSQFHFMPRFVRDLAGMNVHISFNLNLLIVDMGSMNIIYVCNQSTVSVCLSNSSSQKLIMLLENCN